MSHEPWTMRKNGFDKVRPYAIEDKFGGEVARCVSRDDARLVAAAPSLAVMVSLLRDQLQFHISGLAVTPADEGRSHSLIGRAADLLKEVL